MCRLFDKAAIVTNSEATSTTPINPWRLCTVTQVEELKTVLRVIPVAMTTMFLYITIAQVPLFPPPPPTTYTNLHPHKAMAHEPSALPQLLLGGTWH